MRTKTAEGTALARGGEKVQREESSAGQAPARFTLSLKKKKKKKRKKSHTGEQLDQR